MLCKYSRTNSETLAQIRATYAEIRNFFQGIVFLLAHPVHLFRTIVLNSGKQNQNSLKLTEITKPGPTSQYEPALQHSVDLRIQTYTEPAGSVKTWTQNIRGYTDLL